MNDVGHVHWTQRYLNSDDEGLFWKHTSWDDSKDKEPLYIRGTHLAMSIWSGAVAFTYCITIHRSQRTAGKNRREKLKSVTTWVSHTTFMRKMVNNEQLETMEDRKRDVTGANHWHEWCGVIIGSVVSIFKIRKYADCISDKRKN